MYVCSCPDTDIDPIICNLLLGKWYLYIRKYMNRLPTCQLQGKTDLHM